MLTRNYVPADSHVLANKWTLLPRRRRERRAVILMYAFSALICAGFWTGLLLEQ